jgi:multisubunit Na+/H+ antiporter MnhB subunit
VLKAPDAAFTQLIVEILCLIILIRSTIRKDLPFSSSGRWLLNTLITVIFVVLFLGAASKAFKEMPAFGAPIMTVGSLYLKDGFAQTGATNLVAAILQDYRAYDRVAEVTVLFIVFVGMLALLRIEGKKSPAELEGDHHG